MKYAILIIAALFLAGCDNSPDAQPRYLAGDIVETRVSGKAMVRWAKCDQVCEYMLRLKNGDSRWFSENEITGTPK